MYRVIGADGKEYGPVSIEQLRQWIADGRVNAQTQVQAAGGAEWKAALNFESLRPENVSYQVCSGTNVVDVNPEQVLAVCLIRRNVALCDGSVQGMSNSRWQAMQKDLKNR